MSMSTAGASTDRHKTSGCAITEVLGVIRNGEIVRKGSSPVSTQDDKGPSDGIPMSDSGVAAVWHWLVARPEVSVGPNRKYNHLALDEVLKLGCSTAPSSGKENSKSDSSAKESQDSHNSLGSSFPRDLMLHVSEGTMWESITGHSIDYRRLPRSEWILLMGIASRKWAGILQGDLGRLVDQDKRSVPKRTDSLVSKGYIVKRTTLARGTKTSKLWLRAFAPPLPKNIDSVENAALGFNFTRPVLVDNLDPVPWHVRWTGESIDFKALATTIMAITKGWGVLKIQDLKAKLGILGMRWQMKILSKICRFFNKLGVIQYVAAQLDDRIFKDCIKYVRDLNAQDWTLFLATGKPGTNPARIDEIDIADGLDDANQALEQHGSFANLNIVPPWSSDKPLASSIASMVGFSGQSGLTNPDIYTLTMGPAFCRYLSSLATTLSTQNLQPLSLRRLQMRSEHVRAGKLAFYRYVLCQEQPESTSPVVEQAGRQVSEGNWLSRAQYSPYSFISPSSLPQVFESTASLSDLCEIEPRLRARARPNTPEPSTSYQPKRSEVFGRAPRLATSPRTVPDELRAARNSLEVVEASEAAVTSIPADASLPSTKPAEPNSTISTNQHFESSHKAIIVCEASHKAAPSALEEEERQATPVLQAVEQHMPERENLHSPHVDASLTQEQSEISHARECCEDLLSGRGRGRTRGQGRATRRGRPKSTATDIGSHKWKCQKCGDSWKNEGGLRYHLTKSSSSCNDSYVAPATPSTPPRHSAKRSVTTRNLDSHHHSSDAKMSGQIEISSSHCPPRLIGRRALRPQNQSHSEEPVFDFHDQTMPIYQDLSLPAHESHIIYASPTVNQTALLPSEAAECRQFSDLKRHGARKSLPKPSKVFEDLVVRKDRGDEDSGTERLIQSSESHEAGPSQANPSVLLAGNESGEMTTRSSGLPRIHQTSPTLIQVRDIEEEGLPNATKQGKMNSGVRHQIEMLVTEMLADRGGILPGGQPLFQQLDSAWSKKFPHDSLPGGKNYKATINGMVKDKIVDEQWHGYRTSVGRFSQCQVITLPGMDAFSPAALSLVEHLKALDEDSKISTQTPQTSLKTKREPSSGRRSLPQEISVLNAPIYAARAAANRERQESLDDVRPLKRQRLSSRVTDGNDNSVTRRALPPSEQARESKRRKWAKNTGFLADGELSFLEPDRSSPVWQTPRGIQFLTPKICSNGGCEDDLETIPGLARQLSAGGSHSERTLDKKNVDESISPGFTVVGSERQMPGKEVASPLHKIRSFENVEGLSISGWVSDANRSMLANIVSEIEHSTPLLERRLAKSENSYGSRILFRILACMELECRWSDLFVKSAPGSAGPHDIFISFCAPKSDHFTHANVLSWHPDDQLTAKSFTLYHDDQFNMELSSSDDSLEERLFANFSKRRKTTSTPGRYKTKRVPLVTRELTAIPQNGNVESPDVITNTEELFAAFIAVRVLLGGANKAIDWGLLAHVFPNISMNSLRRFWQLALKEHGPSISKYTQIFQSRFLSAYEDDELPKIDFDKPLEYDWHVLIHWTAQIPQKEGIRISRTRAELNKCFTLKAVKRQEEDWRESFFRPQSSVFARLEAAAAEPGVVNVETLSKGLCETVEVTEFDIVKSWIKSLCCTPEDKYSPVEVKERFLALSSHAPHQRDALLKGAIEQLTQQKVLCRSKKPPLGGRPYQLAEWHEFTLRKLAQRAKFREAAALKQKLDMFFRKGEIFKVPYSLDDGSAMALTNLNASGRVKISMVDLPHIPFGFEPGNYESRKFPKSSYHFGLEIMPTQIYQYNDSIDTLSTVDRKDIPTVGKNGAVPQWVDFFGNIDIGRWSDVFGAFCFLFATRGPMTIECICAAMDPILEPFEAQAIMSWGKETGVLRDAMDGVGTTLGEWWWLAVHWKNR